LISNLLSYGSGYILHLGGVYVTQKFQSQMDATRFYPTYTGPALFEFFLNISQCFSGLIREVYGNEGADHHALPLQLGVDNVLHFPALSSGNLERNVKGLIDQG
jgi:hypothetical protein